MGKAFLGTFLCLRLKPLINKDTKLDSVGLVVAQFNFQKKCKALRADKTEWSEPEFWKRNNKYSQTKLKSQLYLFTLTPCKAPKFTNKFQFNEYIFLVQTQG